MTSRTVTLGVTLFVISVPFIGWAVELGVAFTAAHFLGLALIALALGTWMRQRPPVPRDLAVLSLLAFVLVALLTVVRVQLEPDIHVMGESAHAKSIKQLVGLGFGVSVFMALYCLLRWYRLGLTALRTHYWTTAVFAVLSLVQYAVALIDISSPLANFPVHNSTLGGLRALSLMYGFPRVSLTLVEPSILASYLLSGWALWLFALERPPVADNRRRWFVASGFVLGVAVIITGSRLAYVVFALLTAAALAVRPHRWHRMQLVGASVVLGFLLTGPVHSRRLIASLLPKTPPAAAATTTRSAASSSSSSTPGTQASQTPEPAAVDAAARSLETSAATQDISVQQRTASYLVAVRVLRQRPLLGAGLGTSEFYMDRYWPPAFTPLPPDRRYAPTMLSHYATVVTETGVLGALCLASFIVVLCYQLLQLARRSSQHAVVAWSIAGAVGGYFVAGIATALITYQILLVWVLVAIALSLRDAVDERGPELAEQRDATGDVAFMSPGTTQ